MRASRFSAVLGVLLIASLPAAAWAADGILLVQQVTGADTSVTSEVRLEADRLRTEVADPSGRSQVVIFDGTKDVIVIVDEANRRYTELNREQAARMGTAMQGAMAMMQEQLAKMPPEQRRMMEEKMGGMMAAMAGTAKAATPVYKRVGTGQVGRWSCDRYDGFVDGEKTAELCTVAPEVLGFAMADFQVLTKMTEFVQAMLPQLADQFVGFGTDAQGFEGLPVQAVTTMNGTTTTMELTDVRRETFDDALFEVPSGYTRQEMPSF